MSSITKQPVIKKALGENWNNLAPIVKKHYNLSPGQDSQLVIKGCLDEVYHSAIAKLFLIPGRIFGALVPFKGKAIPTEVKNWTTPENQQAMFWCRTLFFPNKPPVIFTSRMEHQKADEIIEYVRFGMGIRLKVSCDNGALRLKGIGYVWNVVLLKIPIPGWMILGNAEIIEQAVSDEHFHLHFEMRHPLFGKTFSYSGTFTVHDHA